MPKKTAKKKLATESLIVTRHTQVLHDIKWKKFMRYARPFRHIPFVEFVFGAGSMAIGDVTPNSDFDVIVSAAKKRIFTARFFSILFFELFGSRRKKIDHHESAADKICLNHFITEDAFSVAPPHGPYRKMLYRNLVPLFGSSEKMNQFWQANAPWLGNARRVSLDARYIGAHSSRIKQAIETILGGNLGDKLEAIVKYLQIRRIEKGLAHTALGYRPRIHWSDKELEFHPDNRYEKE